MSPDIAAQARTMAEAIEARIQAEERAHPLNARPRRFGDRAAGRLRTAMGSWRFLIIQNLLLAAWIALNVAAVVARWDPYPFILLNLILSTQASEVGPVLLIATNQQDAVDAELRDHDHQQLLVTREMLVVVLENLLVNTQLTEQLRYPLLELEPVLAGVRAPDLTPAPGRLRIWTPRQVAAVRACFLELSEEAPA